MFIVASQSNILELSEQRALGSTHLTRLQGILPSSSHKPMYANTQRLGCDFAGDAMSGHCVGNTAIYIFSALRFRGAPVPRRLRFISKRQKLRFEEPRHHEKQLAKVMLLF